MSRILLLLVIVLWMSRQVAPGISGGADVSRGVMLFVGGLLLVVLFFGLWSRVLARNVTGGNIYRSLRRFNSAMLVSRMLIPVWFAFAIYVLGWGRFVDGMMGRINRFPIELPGMLVGTMPAFLAWVGLWWAQFPADRALREQNSLALYDEDFPVHAPPSFSRFFIANLRLQLLFTIVPITLIILLHDIASMIVWNTSSMDLRASVSRGDAPAMLIWMSAIVLVVLFAPEILRRVLETQPLESSPLRARLEQLCRASNLRYRQILLWRTDNVMGNAAVMGLVPQMRYILLSDVLLETMTDEQIEGVFAHEIGHVKHWHMGWFVVVVVTMNLVLNALGQAIGLLAQHRRSLNWVNNEAVGVVATFAGLGMFFLMFGWLSRRFERQADVYAARTIQRLSTSPAIPSSASYVGPAGADVFNSALHRVAVINNIPLEPVRRRGTGVLAIASRITTGVMEHANNYFHGSIMSRMDYLRSISADPKQTARFDRSMSLLYAILILALVIGGGWMLIAWAFLNQIPA